MSSRLFSECSSFNSGYLIVDLDDTLVFTSTANSRAYLRAFFDVTGRPAPQALVIKDRITYSNLSQICNELGDTVLQSIRTRKNSIFSEMLSETSIHEQVFEVVQLYPKEKCFLLSNAREERIRELLAFHRLGEYFAKTVANPTPTENKYLYFFSLLAIMPSACTVLENDPLEVQHALNAGVLQEQIYKV